MHITLMASAQKFYNKASVLIAESISSVIIDSDWSRTVSGKVWLDCLTETLNENEKASIRRFDYNSVFRFGDSREMKSQQCAILTCFLGGKARKFITDVVIVLYT